MSVKDKKCQRRFSSGSKEWVIRFLPGLMFRSFHYNSLSRARLHDIQHAANAFRVRPTSLVNDAPVICWLGLALQLICKLEQVKQFVGDYMPKNDGVKKRLKLSHEHFHTAKM